MHPIVTISEADHDCKIDRPHNPPESNLSEKEFDAEYYKLYDEVEEILARYGENNAYGEGDYYLEPHISNSRGLGLEVTNPQIITIELIRELSDAVRRIDPKWEIYLGSGVFDFGIFISATETQVWKEEDSTLQWQPSDFQSR